MRRGLMAWDPHELPETALAGRLARLRGAMQRERLDAFLLYTNLVRPSAVCWLTGFTPYWSEGALLVLREGAPIFATALSKRVANWMRTTDPVSEIANAPQPGKLLGERLVAAGGKRIGVLELDALPSGLHDDFAVAASSAEVVDASAAFASVRRSIDDAERSMIVHADALAVAALDRIDEAAAADAGAVAGLVEEHARLAGAEEAYIAVAPDLDADRRLLRITRPSPIGRRFAVRASIAYKGAWVRRTRSFARDEDGRRAFARAAAWLAEIGRTIDLTKDLGGQLDVCSKQLAGAALQECLAESCIGSYPLQVIAAGRDTAVQLPGPTEFAVLTIALAVDGVPWIGAAPVLKPARNSIT
jgi:hypothetical protein